MAREHDKLNFIDSNIIDFTNQFSRLSGTVDGAVILISESHLLKGGLLLTVFWWGWLKEIKNQSVIRARLLGTLAGCFIAMVLARTLSWMLPFRLRPLNDNALEFLLPHGMEPIAYESWSSFPSDHAVLFYALSTGLFFISKRVGTIAVVYTTLFICLPRVYLGLHYPTDILGGAFIGIAIVLLCSHKTFNEKISSPSLTWSRERPEIFYPVLFIITFQIAEMFESSRAIINFLYQTVQAVTD